MHFELLPVGPEVLGPTWWCHPEVTPSFLGRSLWCETKFIMEFSTKTRDRPLLMLWCNYVNSGWCHHVGNSTVSTGSSPRIYDVISSLLEGPQEPPTDQVSWRGNPKKVPDSTSGISSLKWTKKLVMWNTLPKAGELPPVLVDSNYFCITMVWLSKRQFLVNRMLGDPWILSSQTINKTKIVRPECSKQHRSSTHFENIYIL